MGCGWIHRRQPTDTHHITPSLCVESAERTSPPPAAAAAAAAAAPPPPPPHHHPPMCHVCARLFFLSPPARHKPSHTATPHMHSFRLNQTKTKSIQYIRNYLPRPSRVWPRPTNASPPPPPINHCRRHRPPSPPLPPPSPLAAAAAASWPVLPWAAARPAPAPTAAAAAAA